MLDQAIDRVTERIREVLQEEFATVVSAAMQEVADELGQALREKSTKRKGGGSKLDALEEAIRKGPVTTDDLVELGFGAYPQQAISALRKKRGLKIELDKEAQVYHLA
jgi:aspartokinase